MTMQTQRITCRSAKFFRATGKAYMVTACCGLVLLSAVSAHALSGANGQPLQGLPFNGLLMNGVTANRITLNGTPLNVIHVNGLSLQAPTLQQKPLPAGSQERLPWNGLSRRALGKSMQ
jgi:hypothetical protein